jgi:hypothetical protein
MSKQNIVKTVQAVICDFCNKEIDVHAEEYCYHRVVTNGEIIPIEKHKITHFAFRWLKKNRKEFVQYDFHAACFDSLMKKFLHQNVTSQEQTNAN